MYPSVDQTVQTRNHIVPRFSFSCLKSSPFRFLSRKSVPYFPLNKRSCKFYIMLLEVYIIIDLDFYRRDTFFLDRILIFSPLELQNISILNYYLVFYVYKKTDAEQILPLCSLYTRTKDLCIYQIRLHFGQKETGMPVSDRFLSKLFMLFHKVR